MECVRRAMLEGQTFEGREQNFKQAAKLMGLYIGISPRSTSTAARTSKSSRGSSTEIFTRS